MIEASDIGTVYQKIELDVQTPPVLHPQGYFVAGATNGCLARITLPADEPRPTYLSTAWPRYRYDNRNSGARWIPYSPSCGAKIWDCPY